MKRRLIYMLISSLLCSLLIFSSTFAYAENSLVPYDPDSPSSSQSVSAAGESQDYTSGLYTGITIVKDENVTSATNTVAHVISVIITFILAVVPVLLSLQLVLDIVAILLKPIALLLAKFPYFQINSNEAIAVTGIPYVGKEGNQSGAQPVDLNGKNPMLYYLGSRVKVIIFALVMCTLIGSGLLFKLLTFVTNAIVGWVAGLI